MTPPVQRNPAAQARRMIERADRRYLAHIQEGFREEVARLRREAFQETNPTFAELCIAKAIGMEQHPDWEVATQIRQLATSVTYRALIRCASDAIRDRNAAEPLTNIALHARLFNAGRMAGRLEERERKETFERKLART